MAKIKNLSDYVKQVALIGKTHCVESDGKKTHFVHYYRGHSDQSYELLPSIARKIHAKKSNLNFEKKMIRRAELRNSAELSNIDNRINLLAKLQHYGLETRLLDITENALVALYFACTSNPDKDGEVVIFEIASDLIQHPSAILSKFFVLFSDREASNLYLDNIFDFYFMENPDVVSKSSIIPYEKYKDLTQKAIMKHIVKPIFVNHAIQSEREIRQQAAFMLFPNRYVETEKMFVPEILPLMKDDELIAAIIKIPKSTKPKLLEELKLFGITDEFLFPELNNRCKSINKDIGKIFADNTDHSNNLLKMIYNHYLVENQ